MNSFKIYVGDALERLKEIPDNSVNCCITSPPYYALRDYGTGKWVGGDVNCPHKRLNKFTPKISTGHKNDALVGNVSDSIYKSVCPICGAIRIDKQVGLEETPEQYIEKLADIFDEIKRILKDDGTLWLNIGDTYYGSAGGRGSNYHDSRTNVVQSGNKGFNDMKYVPKLDAVRNDLKPKDLMGIPWMIAFELRKRGWYLRQDIIWEKPNPMPESVKDRFTKSHEYVFLLTKNSSYYFDHDSVQEDATSKIKTVKPNSRRSILWDDVSIDVTQTEVKPNLFGGKKYVENNDPQFQYYSGNPYVYNGKRNMRDVWNIPVSANKIAHFATFPTKLAEICVLAGCPENGTVLDPFNGSGTSGIVSVNNGRNYIGIELKEDYVDITRQRILEECVTDIEFSEVK